MKRTQISFKKCFIERNMFVIEGKHYENSGNIISSDAKKLKFIILEKT